MKRLFIFVVIIPWFSITRLEAQDADSTGWKFDLEANNYFFQSGDFIFVPVVKADKKWLHLETRYNYEDLETFSAWAGYNFSGGDKITFAITPMVGFATGLTKGMTAGMEFTIGFGKFEIYSENEYLIDSDGKDENFYYHWADITYSPTDSWWFGITGQRTKLYQTNLELQRGILVGGALGNWEFTGYLYNWGFDDPFFLLTAALKF